MITNKVSLIVPNRIACKRQADSSKRVFEKSLWQREILSKLAVRSYLHVCLRSEHRCKPRKPFHLHHRIHVIGYQLYHLKLNSAEITCFRAVEDVLDKKTTKTQRVNLSRNKFVSRYPSFPQKLYDDFSLHYDRAQ